MPELPWIKWFPAYWASEPGLRLCEAATRGIWFEALNTMFLQKTGSVTGTLQELASMFICRTSQMELAIQQLKSFKVADVYEQNGNITLTCRRSARDCKIRHLRVKAGIASGTKRQHESKKVCEHTSPSPSTSSSNGLGMQGEGVRIPSWDEWWAICQFVGLPEWKAKDEFYKQQSKDDPWRGARGNLNSHAARIKTYWECDGRPEQPKSFNKTNGEVPKWQNQKQYDLVCKEIKAIEDRASHTATDMIVEVQDRERYRNLKQQRGELRKSLHL